MSQWTCESCGESYDTLSVNPLQHTCPIAYASIEFHEAYAKFLKSPAGQFAVYYAQRVINAPSGSDNTLVES